MGGQRGLAGVRDLPRDLGAPPPPAARSQGRVWDISLGTQGFPPLHEGSGARKEAQAIQHTPTPRRSPLSSQGSRVSLLPLPPPPGKVGSSLPGRGGQARLGVGLWRPGPGTQQRKFQAITPGCLQGGPSKGQAAFSAVASFT